MPGDSVTLEVWRDEAKISLPVILGERNLQIAQKPPQKLSILGMTFGTLDKQSKEKWGLTPESQGIVIENIESGSPAEEAGLFPGDIILEVQRKTVKSIDELVTTLTDLVNSGKSIIIRYQREKQEPDITIIDVNQ